MHKNKNIQDTSRLQRQNVKLAE